MRDLLIFLSTISLIFAWWEKNITEKCNKAKNFVKISRKKNVASHQFWLNGIFFLVKFWARIILVITYTFEGQVHVFAGRVKIVNALVLQDKCNIEIFLSPDNISLNAWYCWIGYIVVLGKIQLVVSWHLASDNQLSADLAYKKVGRND